MEYVKGDVYTVNHSRKGLFTLRVESEDSTWLTGVIVEGSAGAVMKYNEKYPGDTIQIRKEFISGKVKQSAMSNNDALRAIMKRNELSYEDAARLSGASLPAVRSYLLPITCKAYRNMPNLRIDKLRQAIWRPAE